MGAETPGLEFRDVSAFTGMHNKYPMMIGYEILALMFLHVYALDKLLALPTIRVLYVHVRTSP